MADRLKSNHHPLQNIDVLHPAPAHYTRADRLSPTTTHYRMLEFLQPPLNFRMAERFTLLTTQRQIDFLHPPHPVQNGNGLTQSVQNGNGLTQSVTQQQFGSLYKAVLTVSSLTMSCKFN
ncbi:hypothetical protein DPMN_004390 [Dreissena polymorpha]|uniref:Uncharacterized protein n=1 Tax=Dreissena polymorpha TaxID=45954 RepID=A0A9D4MQ91_DREPO|nr:hypothetical protein DPMN_004390 [Dreissena polymorpha]